MSLDYISRTYSVPAAIGTEVIYSGDGKDRLGVITGANGAHLLIRLQGSEQSLPFHPTWKIEYIDRDHKRLMAEIAVALAVATLKKGDRLRVQRCGGREITVTYKDDWWGCWIVTATLDDIHPLHIVKVNGQPRSIRAEAHRFLSALDGTARQAMLDESKQRQARREEEIRTNLASAAGSDDEIPF
jgi:hypothetical protein